MKYSLLDLEVMEMSLNLIILIKLVLITTIAFMFLLLGMLVMNHISNIFINIFFYKRE